MYYEGLREGLRRACGVELEQEVNPNTDELLMRVKRKGHTLWWSATSRIALQEVRAQEHVVATARQMGNEIIDGMLDLINWDLFFDHEDEFSRRLLNEVQIQNRRQLQAELERLGVPVPNPDAGTRDDSPKPHPYTVIRTAETMAEKEELRDQRLAAEEDFLRKRGWKL